MGHHELALRRARHAHHLGRFVDCERDGFFAQDVLAGPEGLDHVGGMQIRRQGDVHQVHRAVGQEVLELRVGADALEVDVSSGGVVDVAADARPVPAELLFIDIAQGHHLGLAAFLVACEVHFSHESDADHAYADHWCNLHARFAAGIPLESGRSTCSGPGFS